jgi:hypothetical protein
MCSGKVNSVCSTSGARRVTLIAKPDYDKDKWNISVVICDTDIFRNG